MADLIFDKKAVEAAIEGYRFSIVGLPPMDGWKPRESHAIAIKDALLAAQRSMEERGKLEHFAFPPDYILIKLDKPNEQNN